MLSFELIEFEKKNKYLLKKTISTDDWQKIHNEQIKYGTVFNLKISNKTSF